MGTRGEKIHCCATSGSRSPALGGALSLQFLLPFGPFDFSMKAPLWAVLFTTNFVFFQPLPRKCSNCAALPSCITSTHMHVQIHSVCLCLFSNHMACCVQIQFKFTAFTFICVQITQHDLCVTSTHVHIQIHNVHLCLLFKLHSMTFARCIMFKFVALTFVCVPIVHNMTFMRSNCFEYGLRNNSNFLLQITHSHDVRSQILVPCLWPI